jgi:hypothetical protein
MHDHVNRRKLFNVAGALLATLQMSTSSTRSAAIMGCTSALGPCQSVLRLQ